MNYVWQTLSKIFSWLLPFQTEIRQLRNLIVLQKKKNKINKKSLPGVWLPHSFPGWKPVHSVLHFLSTDLQYHFCVQLKLDTKYDLLLSYHLAETMFCVQSLLLSLKLRKTRAQPYFHWATLLAFQHQLHTVQIWTQME